MSKKSVYYGLVGINGYGVYDNYDKVSVSRNFLKASRIKKFDNLNGAKEWVADTFWDLQKEFSLMKTEEVQKLNWTYFIKKHG